MYRFACTYNFKHFLGHHTGDGTLSQNPPSAFPLHRSPQPPRINLNWQYWLSSVLFSCTTFCMALGVSEWRLISSLEAYCVFIYSIGLSETHNKPKWNSDSRWKINLRRHNLSCLSEPVWSSQVTALSPCVLPQMPSRMFPRQVSRWRSTLSHM